jgi:Matrixin
LLAASGETLKAVLVFLLACFATSTTAVSAEPFFKWLRLEGNPVRWQTSQASEAPVLRYRVIAESAEFAGARNCRRMASPDGLLASSGIERTAFQRELAAAFAMWQQVANIGFREAKADEAADIVIGAQAEPEGWAFADVFYEVAAGDPVKPISKALICLNPVKRWKIGFNGDLKTYDLRYTLAHEIGHAIGLDHPDGGAQIMGYRYLEQFRELQPGDIAGAVRLYGKRQLPTESVAAAPPAVGATPGAEDRPVSQLGSTRALDAPPQ